MSKEAGEFRVFEDVHAFIEHLESRYDEKGAIGWLSRRFYGLWNRWDGFVYFWRRGLIGFVQRGRRGYASTDLWDFFSYLDRMLPKALRQFARDPNATPIDPDTDELDEDGMPMSLTIEAWRAILEAIAAGFEAHDKMREWGWETEEERLELQKTFDDGFKLFHKWYGALWD